MWLWLDIAKDTQSPFPFRAQLVELKELLSPHKSVDEYVFLKLFL